MKALKVGLLGIGTVGGGTYTVLTRNQAEIARRAGRSIEIVKVADRNVEHARNWIVNIDGVGRRTVLYLQHVAHFHHHLGVGSVAHLHGRYAQLIGDWVVGVHGPAALRQEHGQES